MTDVIASLQVILDPECVLTEPEKLQERSLDTWPLKLVQKAVGAEPGPQPLCVVRPRSTAALAEAMSFLNQAGVPAVPYGGGSGVAGGAVPAGPGMVVVDVGALDQIQVLDEMNLTVKAGAGVLLGRLEAWLNERGYIGGHYPQSIDSAQLGGLVATRSAGQFSTRYGNMEDLLVGLEAVLPDGRITRIRDLPRRSVGPDLRHLWLGSEGTLGIITEVTLKVFPKPEARHLQAFAIPTVAEGLEAIRRFMREGWRPAVVRLHDGTEAERSYGEHVMEGESILLLLSEGPQGLVAAEAEAVARHVADACPEARPLGEAPVERWLHHRNDVSMFWQLTGMGLIVETIEVAAGWSAIGTIYRDVTERLRREVPELLVVSGHSSHSYPQGTNIYFILAAQPARDPAEVARVYQTIWQKAMETTLALGGTICHHHGIGKLRAPWVPQELGTAYPLLKAVKEALDSRGLMNPGTLLPQGR